MRRFGPRPSPGRRGGDGGESESFEVMLHVFTGLLPDGQQNALTLVVA